MTQTIITYEIDIAYSYDEEDLPNLSMLTTRNLKARIETVLEMSRKDGHLGTKEITTDWIEVL